MLPIYLGFISMKLTANGGSGYCVGASLNVADIALYHFVKNVHSNGAFDHVPTDSDASYPMIAKFINTLEADARFAPHKF
jgi:glutathione S-transferase